MTFLTTISIIYFKLYYYLSSKLRKGGNSISELISALKELDFTEYEAKIYLALLTNHPSNGNTISKISGVPGSKVYEELRKMKENGIVYTVIPKGGKQILYFPLPPKELLKRKKRTFLKSYNFLEKSLEKYLNEQNTDMAELFVINGYESSMEIIKSAISESNEKILISCWRNEYEEIKSVLFEAHRRKVYITLLIFDERKLDVPWKYFSHYNEKTALNRHREELSIVIDEKKAILLNTLNEVPCAIVSTHPIMLWNVRNYIRHDIYVNRILYDFSEKMTEHYGKNLENLINDF